MKYVTVSIEDDSFDDVCQYCFENLVPENLLVNGGTLLYPRAVFQCDFVITASEDDKMIGFIGMVEDRDILYVMQIAVKKTHKRQGVGTTLVEKVKEIAVANNVDLTCHIRDFNTASQSLFQSCGFEVDEEYSEPDNRAYRCKTKDKDKQH